jgi:hypothetical protein
MTCKKELERRVKAVFPRLEDCEAEYIMDSITVAFSPSILGNRQSPDWDQKYIQKELLPFEPSEEEILRYTD